MKFVFLTVSLVSAFTVEPGPDSQHSIIAEQPQWPEITPVPDNLITAEQPQEHEKSLETEHLNETSIITEPPWFGIEEEEDQSENELREYMKTTYENGSSCKAKLSCSILGGSCVSSGARCYGRRVPAGCKGSCDCCIPGCSTELGFFSPPGSKQCFKLFTDKGRNWTDANAKCRSDGLVPAHPYDPVTLRSYLVIRYGYYRPVWLYARGTGSYYYWQDTKQLITNYNYNPLWWPSKFNTSSSYCMMLYAYEYGWKRYPTQPYYGVPCRYGYYTLCELVMK